MWLLALLFNPQELMMRKLSLAQRIQEKSKEKKLSILHIITSVLAAAVGVQSKANQQKDFTNKNSIYIYIAAGILFTVIFVLTVFFVVKAVLANANL